VGERIVSAWATTLTLSGERLASRLPRELQRLPSTAGDCAANACIACGSADGRPFYTGLLRCAACGHGWANLQLSHDRLAEIYGRGYFFGEEYLDYLADRAIIQKNFRLRLTVLDQFTDLGRHRRFLDVGCAYGFFLDLLRQRRKSAVGIDIAEDAVRHARTTLGLDAVVGDLLTHDFGTKAFDVVSMWDTIEHLARPDLYLERIASITESGALVAVTTGDLGSLNSRINGRHWRLIHPPTHLHYFTRTSLARLFDRMGFTIVYDRSCGYYRGVDTAAYNLFVLQWRFPAAYRLLKRLRVTGYDFFLDLLDIRYVLARRR
jgi:SAM-dependent methyltransferase